MWRGKDDDERLLVHLKAETIGFTVPSLHLGSRGSLFSAASQGTQSKVFPEQGDMRLCSSHVQYCLHAA